MKLITTNSYEESCKIIAEEILTLIKEKPTARLGLATGSSPIGIYKILIEAYEKGEADFSKVNTVNLDEYVGLEATNEQSYRYFMDNNLFNHINIDKKNTFVVSGTKGQAGVTEFIKVLDEAPIDYQLLGVGKNGHVGFNEPSTAMHTLPYIVSLTEETIHSNAIFFANINEVPTSAITMGMGGILSAKKVVTIVAGDKHDAMTELLKDDIVSPSLPISFLKLHSNSEIVVSKNILDK